MLEVLVRLLVEHCQRQSSSALLSQSEGRQDEQPRPPSAIRTLAITTINASFSSIPPPALHPLERYDHQDNESSSLIMVGRGDETNQTDRLTALLATIDSVLELLKRDDSNEKEEEGP